MLTVLEKVTVTMKHSFRSSRAGKVSVRMALAACLLAGSAIMLPRAGTPGTHAQLAATIKPAPRADLANTGVLSTTGPAAQPVLVQTIHPSGATQVNGIDIDGSGNLIVNSTGGSVYGFTSAGTQTFSVSGLGATGTDPGASGSLASAPVLSGDGFIYQTNDLGQLYQINPTTQTAHKIWSSSQGTGTTNKPNDGSAFEGTPLIGPDNTIYIATDKGGVLALTPPTTFGNLATLKWYKPENGQQPYVAAQGNQMGNPIFSAQLTYDSTDNYVFAAAFDTNPTAGFPALGSVFAFKAADGSDPGPCITTAAILPVLVIL